MAIDFYDRLLFATIAPIVVLGWLMCTYVIGMTRNKGSELALRRVRHKHISAAFMVASYVYSPVCYTVFQMFVRETFDDGELYLRADYALSCNTSRHQNCKLYAKFMVCIYVVGFPAVLMFWLARNRRYLVQPGRDENMRLQPTSCIWAAYKPSRFYYEVIECARRITVTGIAVFIPLHSPDLIAVVLLLLVVFLFVSESLAPFEKGVDMGLYRWGNGIILASMYVALLLKVDESNEQSEALLAFSSGLIAANICMILAVVVRSPLLAKCWIVATRNARMIIPVVPHETPVFLPNALSADQIKEQCQSSIGYLGDGMSVKRSSVVSEPESSPRRPASFKRQIHFRSSVQG